MSKSFKSVVKEGKACGADRITYNDLKLHQDVSIDSLQLVVKTSFKSGKFPTEWKKSKVTPVFKKGSKSKCENYRPISLLSIPSKIVEHLICSQLTNHLIEFNLQNEHQWGFRASRSTEDVLLHMTEQWRKSLDSGSVVGVIFIDFKKAFDSVSHPVLLKKLSACGVSGQFLSYIQSYLTNRKQFTVVNGVPSEEMYVPYGVPQGSLLGPPCFTLNVNDMPDNVDCPLDQFADDSTASVVSHSVDEVLIQLKHNIENLCSYAANNSLTIHPDKCKILLMKRTKFIGPLQKIDIKGQEIKVVRSCNCLGIIIDDELSWDTHVRKITKSFSSKVKKLYKMREMPKSTLLPIYFQGILSSVLYGIIIWGNCSRSIMQNVEKIHIRAARFIHRIKKRISDNKILQKVNWKPIEHYYKRNIACKAYKLYNGLASPLLQELITKSNSSRKNRNELKLEAPEFRYVEYKRSFRYRVATTWNNIPCSLREKSSISTFKTALKKSDILEKINYSGCQTRKALKHEDYIYY